ncbi:hypothetical protein C2S52_004541 [Perilla frutescens var. hirtella]|nr:hypothetical protein C2S52_004541 [Perilla frutescens var. hirtella]
MRVHECSRSSSEQDRGKAEPLGDGVDELHYIIIDIERIPPPQYTPPSDDPNGVVRSKDVVIDTEIGLSIRIFAPRRHDPPQKLPIVMYVHGGAFCVGPASNPVFHNFVSNLVEKGNVIAVFIDDKLALENPMPIPFDDAWAVFQ